MSRYNFYALLLIALLSQTSCTKSTSASDITPTSSEAKITPGVYEAKLDDLLAAHDFEALDSAVIDVKDGETASRALKWLELKEGHDGSSYIGFLFSSLLWRAAVSVPEPKSTEFKNQAAERFLEAQWEIETEGFQCVDSSAPKARAEFIDNKLLPISVYYFKLPDAQRHELQKHIITYLVLGFQNRTNDTWLCQGGKQANAMSGFVPYKNWREKRHAALDSIIDEAKDIHPPQYFDDKYRMQ